MLALAKISGRCYETHRCYICGRESDHGSYAVVWDGEIGYFRCNDNLWEANKVHDIVYGRGRG